MTTSIVDPLSLLPSFTPLVPVEPARPQAMLLEEIESLPRDAQLLRQGGFRIFAAEARHIPNMLHEIARQRELTFRSVSEGTGQSLDRDAFDDWYLHLFMWDEVAGRLVGAYRMGRTDYILREHGPRGLYTSTLFEFAPEFLAYLNPALELGRSFIVPDYQRQHQTLSMLWRGIGAFVARQPKYHLLFGPVSISRDYSHISQSLMVSYLRRQRLHPQLSSLVTPRAPFLEAAVEDWLARAGDSREAVSDMLASMDQVTALVSSVEPDRKGVPVLLRHYLKLNAYALNFNVDAMFSDVLDVLVLTDLRLAPSQMMRRYLGDAGYANFVQATSV